ncbi:hypothetical protein D6783_06100 [Candidatus Woesearchaeota archaeon]|nr:MAG: hypothetical protein D6783_06100 [Candidatus Woesearchaeota archaeon]
MPQRDGTGPEGKGPRTGRQMGRCAGAKEAGEALDAGAFRQGRKHGGGRGRGPCKRGLRRQQGRWFAQNQDGQNSKEADSLSD